MELDSSHPGDIIASTSNGGITMRLPALTNAMLSAETSRHDSIYSDFDITMHGQMARYRMEGTIGSGGPRIELRTSNGNIRLTKKT